MTWEFTTAAVSFGQAFKGRLSLTDECNFVCYFFKAPVLNFHGLRRIACMGLWTMKIKYDSQKINVSAASNLMYFLLTKNPSPTSFSSVSGS